MSPAMGSADVVVLGATAYQAIDQFLSHVATRDGATDAEKLHDWLDIHDRAVVLRSSLRPIVALSPGQWTIADDPDWNPHEAF